ncbi:hypothetical protein CTZ27_18030 [Streptomyces griseocarneus]|nr:hypothetical protein CTZ27_18030 [Streptomyces griseocarneus]
MYGLVPVVHSAGFGAVDPHPGCGVCAWFDGERHRATALQEWLTVRALVLRMSEHGEDVHRVLP